MGLKEKIKSIFRKAERERKVIMGEESKDKAYFTQRTFNSLEEALAAFDKGKRRLYDVNRWSRIPRLVNSKFQLYNPEGELRENSKPMVGDYIKINLPGPFPENWVRVIAIHENKDMAEFVVSPSDHPKSDSKEVKHFFDRKATSTFRIERQELELIASEVGKRESVNTSQPNSGNRPIVNTMIAEGGWAGIQKIQWKNLTDYLVGLT